MFLFLILIKKNNCKNVMLVKPVDFGVYGKKTQQWTNDSCNKPDIKKKLFAEIEEMKLNTNNFI